MRKLKHGDVVKVDRGLYSHYGVYANEKGKESVIHYNDDGGKRDFKGKVSETSVEKFMDGAGPEKLHACHFDGNKFSGDETVERARSKLGDEDYNLFTNNCEHLATWSKTGEKKSTQVRTGVATLSATIAAGLGILVAAAGRKKT